jgi:hypothetical protein
MRHSTLPTHFRTPKVMVDGLDMGHLKYHQSRDRRLPNIANYEGYVILRPILLKGPSGPSTSLLSRRQ